VQHDDDDDEMLLYRIGVSFVHNN